MHNQTAGLVFPEEYRIKGDFELYSGGRSDSFYDVNSMLMNQIWMDRVIELVPIAEHYVGIATGGSILATVVGLRRGVPYSMIHDDELKGSVPKDGCLLIDDVVTTTNSFVRGVEILKKNGIDEGKIRYFSVLDRRHADCRNLFGLTSVFDVGERASR